jgi:amino acid adenylation domain-containing protein
MAVRLQGDLHRVRLEQSVQVIVSKHESLRTTFVKQDGQVGQQIASGLTIPLQHIDLTQVAAREQAQTVREQVSAAIQEPFDLVCGPLLRVQVYCLSETEHVLLINMHHIISDGWSIGVLVRELLAAYQMLVENKTPELEPLSVQYPDFAAWQREWLCGEVLEQQLQFWKNQFYGELPTLELPTDYSRPAIQTFNGALEKIRFSKKLTQHIQQLAQETNTTMYMLLMSAYAVLLSVLARQNDVVIGTPIANRNRTDLENMIGFFVNTLAIRTNLRGEPDFLTVLKQVKETTLQAQMHQDLPFEKLVDELHPVRDLSRTPIFQTMFVFQNTPLPSVEHPDMQVELFDFDQKTTHFDLTLAMAEEAGTLVGAFEYNTDLYQPQTIRRWVKAWERLLEIVVQHPTQSVAEYALLSEAEVQTLVHDWNATQREYPTEKCVHTLFEEQVKRLPDANAIIFGDTSMSYAQLNTLADHVAALLLEKGVEPGDPIGICLDRSPEMIVSMLAVLKINGAYVPLDPGYPLPRLEYMLKDTGSPLVITQTRYHAVLPQDAIQVLDIDLEQWAENEASERVGLKPNTAQDTAYIMYTSGSTGKPKGVAIPHHGITRLVINTNYVHLSANERIAHFSNVSFDASTFEIWGALLLGGTIVGFAKEEVLSPDIFTRLLTERKVSILFVTTALFNQLAATQPSIFSAMRYVLFGGEVVDMTAVKSILQSGKPEHLLHVYGPTENTTFTTSYEIQDVAPKAVTIPIGKPIANTTCYVLDKKQRPIPIGVPGELYVGGDGLAKGYINQPELTAEKFIQHPFSTNTQDRLYRTGDVVRWNAEGVIEFIGRADQQVKIRGFRIELGEIEATLSKHAFVQQAVVIAREDKPGDKKLVAYVVSPGQDETLIADLRETVKKDLPEYMLPQAFVVVESLPLTPNGKVDQKALPAPTWQSEAAYVAPQGALEEALTVIWQELLGLEKIGRHSDFFELGGHSLLATQVVSRIQQDLKKELPLRHFFENASIAGLAQALETHFQQDYQSISKRTTSEAPGLSFSQERLWIVDQLEPGTAAYNIPMAMRLRGPIRPEALEKNVNTLVARHESLRTTFVTQNNRTVQCIAKQLSIPLGVHDVHSNRKQEREKKARALINKKALEPFDLMDGPLLRCDLIRLSDQEHIVLFNVHHIISDGWSIGILIRELMQLYAGQVLPDLPLQYADFAVWQRSWMQGEVLEKQLGFWKEKLSGELPSLKLPTDYKRPSIQTVHGAIHRFVLPKTVQLKLKPLCQARNATPAMVLLAAFKVFLSRYANSEDIIVGTPIANRNRVEIENLIGFFVNTLAIRSDLSGNPTFQEVIGQVRDNLLGAYAHQDLPFERLVDELQPKRDLSRSPIFQVMFIMQNTPLPMAGREDLEITPFEYDQQTAHFDLTLAVGESAGQWEGSFEYNVDLFTPETIKRMSGHFLNLMTELITQPEAVITGHRLQSESESQTLLTQWNATQSPVGDYQTLHTLVEQQASRVPEKNALRAGAEHVSYAELNARANQWAAYLNSLGVGAETLVGVCLERTVHLPVVLLGIVKAGGAYVPLDPAFPKERLDMIVEDSQPRVIVTETKLAGVCPDSKLAKRVCVDAVAQSLGGFSTENPTLAVTGSNRAYVLFTSGSTGRPKGVEIEHRSVVNFILSMQREPGCTEQDVLLAVTTISFDISVLEFFLPLSVGAQLVLLDRDEAMSPEKITESLQEYKITLMQATPSTWEMLEQYQWSGKSDLIALVGGEALPMQLAQRLLPKIAALWNMYGPTETTIWSSVIQIRADESITIGRPIANTSFYIVDEYQQPVPLGVLGELLIGGYGVARGYLGRTDLTQERFVPNVFEDSETRLYRTGDVCRYLPDGRVEYLHRLDNQVKIRGFRIELGEIETAMLNHSDVRQAVAAVQIDSQGNKRLIGYVVSEHENSDLSEQVRHIVQGQLPAYMIPEVILELEAMPLTANNKVDRKSLPVPQQERKTKLVKPRTEMENILVGIWQQVLKLEQVGVQDNFFEVGGQSLLGIQVITKLRELLKTEVPHRVIMQAPTIEQLAIWLETNQSQTTAPQQQQSPLVLLQPRGELQPVFLVHPMDGSVMCYQHLAMQFGGTRPVYGLEAPARLGLEKPFDRMETMAKYFIDHIRSVQPEGPYVIGGWSFGGIVAYEIVAQLLERKQSVRNLFMLDASAPAGERSNTDTDNPEIGLLSLASTFEKMAPDNKRPFSEVLRLDPQALQEYVIGLLVAGQKTNVPARQQELTAFMQLFLAHMQALAHYQPKKINQDIHVLRASKSQAFGDAYTAWLRECLFVEKLALRAQKEGLSVSAVNTARAAFKTSQGQEDQALGWRAFTSGEIRIWETAGDHENMIFPPHIITTAKIMQSILKDGEPDKILI